MDVSEQGRIHRIGMSASNILGPKSDPEIAYEVALARADYYLKSPKHSRETFVEFKQDWDVVQSARANRTAREARAIDPVANARVAGVRLRGSD
jgi:hypothetical protein